MTGAGIDLIERVIDDFWLRDSGPTFVHAADGSLAAVDWIFNGWGGGDWTSATHDRGLAAFAPRASLTSSLVQTTSSAASRRTRSTRLPSSGRSPTSSITA
jgi:agmatine/peptidylarginine deiminase